MRGELSGLDLDIRVQSAGVNASSGASATPEAVRASGQAGYDLMEHRSQRLKDLNWERVFLVACMTKRHIDAVRKFLKGQCVKPEVAMLSQLAGSTEEIKDPFGGALARYEEMVEQLEQIVQDTVESIIKVYCSFEEEGEMMAEENSLPFTSVAVGCDHAGYPLKPEIIQVLEDLGLQWKDLGTDSEESVDYPEFAHRVAEAVAEGSFDAGILICGTGLGMSMAANKVSGIRAAVCSEEFSVRGAREHNNANILALGARVLGPGLAAELVRIFCQTNFAGGRHARRLNQISPE